MASLALAEFLGENFAIPAIREAKLAQVNEALSCLNEAGQYVALCHSLAGGDAAATTEEIVRIKQILRENKFFSQVTLEAIKGIRRELCLPTGSIYTDLATDVVLTGLDFQVSQLDYGSLAESGPGGVATMARMCRVAAHPNTGVAVEMLLRSSDAIVPHTPERFALVLFLQALRGNLVDFRSTFLALMRNLFGDPPKTAAYLQKVAGNPERAWGSLYDLLFWTTLTVLLSSTQGTAELCSKAPAVDVVLDISPKWKSFTRRWAFGDRDKSLLPVFLRALRMDPLTWRASSQFERMIAQAEVQSTILASSVVRVEPLMRSFGNDAQAISNLLSSMKFVPASPSDVDRVGTTSPLAGTYIKTKGPELTEHFRTAQFAMDRQSWAAEQRKRIHRLKLSLAQFSTGGTG